jgi:hypothetical protein
MVSNFLNQYNLAIDLDFQKKVKMAAIKTSIAITNEDQGSMSNDKYLKRHNLAVSILRGEDITNFCFAVAANPAINETSTDDDIEYTVVSVFNSIAGCFND